MLFSAIVLKSAVALFCCWRQGSSLQDITVELQWFEHLWDHKNKFETGLVRAIEG